MSASGGGVVCDIAELLVPDMYLGWQSQVFLCSTPHAVKCVLHFADDGAFESNIDIAPILHGVANAYAACIAHFFIDHDGTAVVAEKPGSEILDFEITGNESFPKEKFDAFFV